MTCIASLDCYLDIGFTTSNPGLSARNHSAHALWQSTVQGQLLRAVHACNLELARLDESGIALAFPAYSHAPWQVEADDGTVFTNGWFSRLGDRLRLFGTEETLVAFRNGRHERHGRSLSSLLTAALGKSDTPEISEPQFTPRTVSRAVCFRRSRTADRCASTAAVLRRHDRFKQHLAAKGVAVDMELLNRRFDRERQRLMEQTDGAASLPFAEVVSSSGDKSKPFRLSIEKQDAPPDAIVWTDTPISSYGLGAVLPVF